MSRWALLYLTSSAPWGNGSSSSSCDSLERNGPTDTHKQEQTCSGLQPGQAGPVEHHGHHGTLSHGTTPSPRSSVFYLLNKFGAP